jgi:hypothetical protein
MIFAPQPVAGQYALLSLVLTEWENISFITRKASGLRGAT